MSTGPLLELLRSKARHTHEELAELLALSEAEVRAKIAAWGEVSCWQVHGIGGNGAALQVDA